MFWHFVEDWSERLKTSQTCSSGLLSTQPPAAGAQNFAASLRRLKTGKKIGGIQLNLQWVNNPCWLERFFPSPRFSPKTKSPVFRSLTETRTKQLSSLPTKMKPIIFDCVIERLGHWLFSQWLCQTFMQMRSEYTSSLPDLCCCVAKRRLEIKKWNPSTKIVHQWCGNF